MGVRSGTENGYNLQYAPLLVFFLRPAIRGGCGSGDTLGHSRRSTATRIRPFLGYSHQPHISPASAL